MTPVPPFFPKAQTMRDETGYAHLLRVRIGPNGPTGRLLRCEKKDGSGHYWKVKLDTGEWVWPADLHVDGKGNHVQHCRECRLPFIGNGIREWCYRCEEELFGSVTGSNEPSGPRLRTHGPRFHEWQRGKHRV